MLLVKPVLSSPVSSKAQLVMDNAVLTRCVTLSMHHAVMFIFMKCEAVSDTEHSIKEVGSVSELNVIRLIV